MGLQKRKLLYDTEYFPHYYLFTYIPKGLGGDRLSQSLLNFKNGVQPHQQAWEECAIHELKKLSQLKGCYVVRALSHSERSFDATRKSPINALTVGITASLRGTHATTFLSKSRDCAKLSMLTKAERDRETHDLYQFECFDRSAKHILIVDDILTTGITVKSIIAAILKVLPSVNISVFTLAHTDYSRTNEDVELKSKYYTWQPEGWMVAEANSPEYAATLERIKECIMADSFV